MNRRERRHRKKEPVIDDLPPEVYEQMAALGIHGRMGKVQVGGNITGMVKVTCIRCGRTGHMPADDAPSVGAMCFPCVADVMEGKE